MPCPVMPGEYKEKVNDGLGGGNLTKPRKWTSKEVEWMNAQLSAGFSRSEVAEAMGRTEVSVSIKLKRLSKTKRSYNSKHIDEKYECNRKFLDLLQPTSILDVYAGKKFYKDYPCKTLITNDIDPEMPTDYHEDALKFMCMMYLQNQKFDLIDLDPFGSAYDCFDFAVKMAKKGLVVTFGEYGHKRWKRTDYVDRYYGVTDYNDICPEVFNQEIQKIAKRNKKVLVPEIVKTWENIVRIWYRIEPMKITEQWDHHGPNSAAYNKEDSD